MANFARIFREHSGIGGQLDIQHHKIVFYDGDCGFCNRAVQFVLDHEKGSELYFCALQSETARSFFAENGFPQPDLSTIYFWNGKTLFDRSAAALKVTAFFRFPWSLIRVFVLVPRFIRDGVYNWIARRRHKLSAANCALPTPDQRRRFI